ncbi:MAG: DUF5063 domain-containing protein [Lachnospiraceae bacterium]|nr:DUF5063 domain-containing protein [Lachnospiraceae bacterium]
MTDSTLSNNQLAFLGLSNEYCHAVETASETDRDDFVATMLRLLPRIYISATDLPSAFAETDGFLPQSLEEDYYDAVRRGMEMLLGEDDTYLEVFEEDMKYSDTPIAASISEGLADIFQVLYNLTAYAKEAPIEEIPAALESAKEDFEAYWSKSLCNVQRALNGIRYA